MWTFWNIGSDFERWYVISLTNDWLKQILETYRHTRTVCRIQEKHQLIVQIPSSILFLWTNARQIHVSWSQNRNESQQTRLFCSSVLVVHMATPAIPGPSDVKIDVLLISCRSMNTPAYRFMCFNMILSGRDNSYSWYLKGRQSWAHGLSVGRLSTECFLQISWLLACLLSLLRLLRSFRFETPI